MSYSELLQVFLERNPAIFMVLIVIFGIALIFLIPYRALGRAPRSTAVDLVLESYTINENDPLDLVHMVGRRAGFWGRLAHELGLAKFYEMHVSERFVMFMAPGFREGFHAVLPVGKIVTVAYEYRRPVQPLFLAIALGLLPFLPWVSAPLKRVSEDDRSLFYVVCWGCAFVCMIYYLVRREIKFMISAGDGYWIVRYMVGHVGSFEKAAATVNLVRNLITGVRPVPGHQHFGHEHSGSQHLGYQHPGSPVSTGEPAYPASLNSIPAAPGVVDIELGVADRKSPEIRTGTAR